MDSTVSLSNFFSWGTGSVLVMTTSLIREFFKMSTAGPESTPCVAATHGVLSGPAIDTLKNSRISEVVITNTLPVPQENQFDKLTVLSIAPLIARAINEVFNDGSVTSLFDGQS